MIKHQTTFLLFVKNVSKLFNEIRLCATQINTYQLLNKLKEEVIDNNITLSSKFNLDVENDFKTLPINAGSQRCTRFQLEQSLLLHLEYVAQRPWQVFVTKAFKLIFKQIQSYHEKLHFYKTFWIVENSNPVTERWDQVNTK